MFILKKLLGALLLPLPLLLILLVVGAVMLWRKNRFRAGRRLVAVATVLLVVLSFKLVPFELGRALEAQYPPYAALTGVPAPEFVVVLGGGAGDDLTRPAPSRLSAASLARLVEGIRIVGLHPESKLVVSGGRVFTRSTEAETMAESARLLGLANERIIVESASRDTEEQAQRLREVVGGRPFVLVTSAVHMPRSVALFKRQGLAPIPAPAGHRFDPSFVAGPRAFLPSAEHVRSMESVLHEYYGFVWAWMRGRV